ncbi:hypothetical protein HY251_00480 [bacterium]|nr:hypothetical protein [bacterium]
MIDNPQYTNWAKFKVGTSVTTKTSMVSDAMTMDTETTTTLVELTKEKAVVEIKTKTSMEMKNVPKQPPTENTMKMDVAAKIEKGKDDPNAKKAKEGTDTVDIGGTKYKCKTYESESEAAGSKTVTKSWICDDVPGSTVKMESNSEGANKSKMTIIVTKIDKK